MSRLVDLILDQIPRDIFSDTELGALLTGDTNASRYNRLKRSFQKNELIQIRRGLYQLGKRYQREPTNVYELAARLYGPSYVSFESALSYHQLIPEAVRSISSATSNRSKEWQTPHGLFTYSHIPVRAFSDGVERVSEKGHSFLMATPIKALADYVFVNRLNWMGLAPLVDSLRLDHSALQLRMSELAELQIAYNHPRVSRFLDGVKKDLRR